MRSLSKRLHDPNVSAKSEHVRGSFLFFGITLPVCVFYLFIA